MKTILIDPKYKNIAKYVSTDKQRPAMRHVSLHYSYRAMAGDQIAEMMPNSNTACLIVTNGFYLTIVPCELLDGWPLNFVSATLDTLPFKAQRKEARGNIITIRDEDLTYDQFPAVGKILKMYLAKEYQTHFNVDPALLVAALGSAALPDTIGTAAFAVAGQEPNCHIYYYASTCTPHIILCPEPITDESTAPALPFSILMLRKDK